jgi:hypothetical protein
MAISCRASAANLKIPSLQPTSHELYIRYLSHQQQQTRSSLPSHNTSHRVPRIMLSLTSLTLLALTGQTVAWGGLGHRTVGYLAQHLFSEDASQLIQDLLKPTDTFDISDAAVWPDTIRMRQPFTEGWHFIGKTSGVIAASPLFCP